MFRSLDSLDRLEDQAPACGGAWSLPEKKNHHPAARAVPIAEVAVALGLTVSGRSVRCFNGPAHRSGWDEHPSLVLFPDSGRFHCMACGVGGDTISLVRSVRGVSFPEAVAWLTNLAGGRTSLPPRPPLSPSRSASGGPGAVPGMAASVYAALYEVTSEPAVGTPAGDYLRGRALDPARAAAAGARELVDPGAALVALRDRFGDDGLRQAGLLSRTGGLLFARHPLLFFYLDSGRPEFVQARDVTGTITPKELRPAVVACPVPFNADALRQPRDTVYVCEGCIDTLSAVQMGLDAVGIPGVQAFREEWYALFGGVGRVVLLFDDDEAGRSQAAELRSRFRLRGLRAEARFPTGAKDVNALLQLRSR